jgi:hypothetical protein
VKSPDLRPLHERARKLAHGFAYFAIEHVPRDQNREADELANIALDRTGSRSSGNAALDASSGENARVKPEAKASARSGSVRLTGGERTIRARYAGGALHPLEALDLAEGEIVDISIRRPRNPS